MDQAPGLIMQVVHAGARARRRPAGYRLALTVGVLAALLASPLRAAVPAGYSEFVVPGDEDAMYDVLQDISGNDVNAAQGMYSAISVTAWANDVTVYYDHWENGYTFDPQDPDATADQVVVINRGQTHTFTSRHVPIPRSNSMTACGGGPCYDGRDLIYVAGGGVVVTRGTFPEEIDGVSGVVIAFAFEVFPVRPFLESYTAPIGADLAGWPSYYQSFRRVYALIQATEDNTTVTVNGAPVATLQKGEAYTRYNLQTGDQIVGSAPLQVQYIAADETATYEVRGFSAYPDTLWDRSYYAPVESSPTTPTELFLFNPHDQDLTIQWEDLSGSGTGTIPAQQTRSYTSVSGHDVPVGSGVQVTGSDTFWGVSVIDDGDSAADWGYSLVPRSLLQDEYFIGWAPGADDQNGDGVPDGNYSPIFITAVEDGTEVIVDIDGDGVPEDTVRLDRLESVRYYSPIGNDLTGARLRANRPIAAAYGQDPRTAPAANPSLDLGYTCLPSLEAWMDLVLTVDKTVDPAVLPAGTGQSTTFRLTARSFAFDVDDVVVEDLLPTGWSYLPGTTTIIMPDGSLVVPNASDPMVISGQQCEDTTAATCERLRWGAGTSFTAAMAPHQSLVVTFDALASGTFAAGDLSLNTVEATGTRTLTGISNTRSETFSPSDNVFYTYNTLDVSKASSAGAGLTWGEDVTYTVTVTNSSSASATLDGISVIDTIPDGLSYVAGSGEVTGPAVASYADTFSSQSYSNSDGSLDWTSVSWIESGDGNPGSPTGGDIVIGYDQGDSRLALSNSDNAIARGADTSSFSSITISFDYRRDSFDNGNDWVDFQICNDYESGNPTWTSIARFAGSGTDWSYQPFDFSVTDPDMISTHFAVRFLTSNHLSAAYRDRFWVDNLTISGGRQTVTTPSSDPPSFVSPGDGYSLQPGEILTLTYHATVDDPLAAGINEITNTAEVRSSTLPIPAEASVTDPVPIARIGDRVWHDLDDDGVVDTGEPGLPNVTVHLVSPGPNGTFGDGDDRVMATTTTNATGGYLFELNGLPAGTYRVDVDNATVPSSLTSSVTRPDPTASFTLGEGETYRGADVGYVAADSSKAMVGHLVWSDADLDGIRDPGEPGIGGVHLALYLDANHNGTFEPGTDPQVAATVTAPDGTYLFTGVDPDDYFVDVTDHDGTTGSGALTGYVSVHGPQAIADPTPVLNLDAGDVLLVADFAFHNPTLHRVTDSVWYDADGDGYRDSGEVGRSGVTVDLVDAGGNVIATSLSAPDGSFSFDGVADGSYRVRIADDAGVLTGYTPTTSAAQSGERTVTVAGADVIGVNSFGYTLHGAIGDMVFSDGNGNGTQDAGEPGLAGVTVVLWRDADRDGVFDSSVDTQVGTAVTDAGGRYLFTRQPPGVYFVSVDDSQGALAGFNPTSSDQQTGGNAAGTQRNAILPTPESSVTGADFGYQNVSLAGITGTVWEDRDGNGIPDEGSSGLEAVTLILRDAAGELVATTASAADGSYSFSSLPSGTYTVTVSDENSVLLGTTSTTGGDTQGSLSPGTPGVDFGYQRPQKVTLATIASFRVVSDGQRAVVEWSTTSELGTVGFHVDRWDAAAGRFVRRDGGLLPALVTAPQGGVYRFLDSGVLPGDEVTYRLVEDEVWGTSREHGPYEVTVERVDPITMTSTFTADPHPRNVGRRVVRGAVASGPGSRVRVAVRDAGLYHLTSADLAGALGVPATAVQTAITAGQVRLSNRGHQVAWRPDPGGAGLTFYAESLDSQHTLDNVYWVDPEQGTEMAVESTGLLFRDGFERGDPWAWSRNAGSDVPAPASLATSSSETIDVEQDVFAGTVVATDPDSDFWFWSSLVGGSPTSGRRSFTLTVPSPAAGTSAELTARLEGASSTAAAVDHHVQLLLNGEFVGEAESDGIGPFTVTAAVPAGLLAETNTVEVVASAPAAGGTSIVYVDGFELTYTRRHIAVGGGLELTASGTDTVVEGFSSAAATVLDVSHPLAPRVVGDASVAAADGGYRVRFPSVPGHRYLATTAEGVKIPHETTGRTPVDLTSGANGATVLVITPRELAAGAQLLTEYRASTGVSARTVILDDVYDQFTEGIADPHALQDFIAVARSSWNPAPQAVVLVGKGTFDERDLLGVGDCLMPTLFTATPFGLFAADGLITDLDGDALPDLPVGRIPALDNADVAAYVVKEAAFEQGEGAWRDGLLLLADDRDPAAGDFGRDSDILARTVPDGFDLEKVYLDEHELAAARQLMSEELGQGTWWANYVGHGGMDRLASVGLLTLADVAGMDNHHPPVLSALTCIVNRFAVPGVESLGEALTLRDDGGAMAVWSPTGMSANFDAMQLNLALFQEVLTNRDYMLGDALLNALHTAAAALGPDAEPMLRAYTLLGDPSLVIRRPGE